jgi:hypothetical protein
MVQSASDLWLQCHLWSARVFGAALHDRVTNSFGLVVRTALRPAHSPVHCQFGLIVEEEDCFLDGMLACCYTSPSLFLVRPLWS